MSKHSLRFCREGAHRRYVVASVCKVVLCHDFPTSTFYSSSETLRDRQTLARRRPHVPVEFVVEGEFFSPRVGT